MLLSQGLRKGVVVAAVAVFLMGWVLVLPPATARQGWFVAHGHDTATFTVSPTGTDDTANIQAAFDGCISQGRDCTVQLGKGVFHTAPISTVEIRGT